MLSIVVFLSFMAIIGWRYFSDKPTFGWLCAYSFLTPYLTIGNFKIDSLYLGIVILSIFIIIKEKGRIVIQKRSAFNSYYKLTIFLTILFLFSWIIFNRNNINMLIVEIAGSIKLCLVLLFMQIMNYKFSMEVIKKDLWKMIVTVIFLNFAFCMLQMYYKDMSLYLMHELRSEASYSFALECTKWGGFTRYFGIMPYPMHLAIFLLASICFIGFEKEIPMKGKWLVVICIIVCGALTASKTFLVGLGIILFCWILFDYYFGGRKKTFIIPIFLVVAVAFLSITFFDEIRLLLQQYVSETAAQQWDTLANLSAVFKTRYSSEADYLAYMPEFIKEYWLMGVGPASIASEAIIDSAFYVLIHNGGVIALTAVIFFYIYHIRYIFKYKMYSSLMLIIVILISGMGFPSWYSSSISIWILGYVFFVETNKRREKQNV